MQRTGFWSSLAALQLLQSAYASGACLVKSVVRSHVIADASLEKRNRNILPHMRCGSVLPALIFHVCRCCLLSYALWQRVFVNFLNTKTSWQKPALVTLIVHKDAASIAVAATIFTQGNNCQALRSLAMFIPIPVVKNVTRVISQFRYSGKIWKALIQIINISSISLPCTYCSSNGTPKIDHNKQNHQAFEFHI